MNFLCSTRVVLLCTLAVLHALLTPATLRAGVIINEIMYQPATLNTNEEWIELWNNDTNTLNLQGWRFTRGIDFTFTNNFTLAPGAYLVIAARSNVFAANYPAVAAAGKVVGNWTGTLRNSGDTIRLEDALGNEIDQVTYATEGDWAYRKRGELDRNHRGWAWYAPHDGTGKTLELINPNLKKNTGQNWAASTPFFGTPGAVNSVMSTDTAPLILDTRHYPLVPASTNTVTISAEIISANGVPTTVRAWWRVDADPQAAPFTSATMFDDGAHNDGLAGDGIYAAVLPAQPHGKVVEFYVEAISPTAKTRTWPAAALPAFDGIGPSGQVANALYQVDNNQQITFNGQPMVRLIMTAAELAERDLIARTDTQSDAEVNTTLITTEGAGSELRYLCGLRERGAGSRGAIPPNHRMNVPNDRPWHGTSRFNLNAQYTHAQVAGAALAARAGLDTEIARAVQLRLNGLNPANAGSRQYGSYVQLEAVGSEFVSAHFPLDDGGNIYRASIGSHAANLNYIGTNVASYISAGYIKANNSSENDWSDLINLTAVLNNTPDATYAAAVRQAVDVEQWMLYFAVFTFLDSEESSLGTGCGDDYGMYRGSLDSRFKIVAHDFDTILNQGDTRGNFDTNIFRMVPAVNGRPANNFNNATVLNRFMLHPEFAPIYYATLKRLIDTVYSNAELSRTIDEQLGSWVPQNVVTSMKTFATNRNAYIRSVIPLTTTASSSLPVVAGFPQSVSASATVFGQSDAIRTRTVLVNGATSSWTAWSARWTNSVALVPGINRVLIQSLDATGAEIGRTNYDIWYNTGGVSVSGALSTNANWTAAGGPYNVTGALSVPAGRILTIQPGATLFIAAGASITVNGQLLAQGNETQRIRFTKVPGGGSWGSLDFINTGATESKLAYVDFDSCAGVNIGGHAAQLHVNNSRIFIDHCTWANTPAQQYISFDASSFVVQNSVFPTYPWATDAPEMLHGANGIPAGGWGIFRDNYFGHTYGANDTIDFTGGQRPGPILQIIGNVFDGAGDDHLDLDSTDAWIEGNIFMHSHRDPNRVDDAFDTASAISGGVDVAGQYSEWTIINNLFYDLDHAVLVKQGNRFNFVNNTVVHVGKESGGGMTNDIAVFNFTDKQLAPPDPALGAGGYIANNIIWDVPALTANYVVPNNTVIFESNLMQLAWSGPGSNNIVGDPRLNLQLIGNITNADWATVKSALAPRTGSLAFGNGWGSKYDKGGFNSRGLMIVGEPQASTTNTSALLRVLPGGTFNWGSSPYLAGYSHYKWKLDNGAWSAELPITTQPTISLNGLGAGAHTVYVVGKNDAGYYQDDTFVYPTNSSIPAHVTASRTWVITNLPGRVQLNEVLAHNTGGVDINGGSPDVIELFNPGNTSIDLSGVGVTDDAAAPYKFFFPPGTVLGAQQYVVLLGDSEKDTNYFHLGFALNQSGDEVFLFDSVARGGAVLDSVVFGVQLANLPVARMPDGSWSLGYPTFGSANVRYQTGDSSRILINEWLTAHAAGNDFIELYNSDSAPANIGGCFISDTPASAPTLHQFPPLTFAPANGFLVLVPDGNPQQGADHLNFKLAPEIGAIAFYSPLVELVDLVVYGPQSTGISEGRSPDGASLRAFFSEPTPGSPNPSANNVIITITNLAVNLFGIPGKSWRYDSSGLDRGTNWRAAAYDDSSWPSGSGLFGFESSSNLYLPYTFPTFVASPSRGGPTTVYFRTHFNWSPPGGLDNSSWTLVLTNFADDGTVFYLNGVEFGRVRVNANPVYFTNFAGNASEPALDILTYAVTNMVVGDNVLAVELHQADLTSSDAVFGLALGAQRSFTNITQLTVVLSEVMANNRSFTNADGSVSDWVEIYNPTAGAIDLSGMSLSDDPFQPTRWVFPPGVSVPAGSYLVVKFDSGAPASTNFSGGLLNTGFGFDSGGDRVLLYDKQSKGGSQIDAITFGLQAPDFTISRVPNASGSWKLSLPTEGAGNIAASVGNPAFLRINEWMPAPRSGDDWFELYNPNAQPVELSGLYLTDNLNDRTQYRIPDRSFIGTGLRGFVQFLADDNATQGADHTNFKLANSSEAIALYASDGITTIDWLTYTNVVVGVSQGRFPDGATNIVSFPETPTPGDANFLPFNDLYINEVLTHSDPPLEDAIELFNPTATPVNIGGWYLSDSRAEPRKFRIPDNTIVQAFSFAVFYENQFNALPGTVTNFALSSGSGDNIHLSVADAFGNLTGYRVTEDFGPQVNGVTFGKFETSIGYEFTAMSGRSFGVDNPATVEQFRTGAGATNPYPRVGPVVINEIHYHPPDLGTNDNAVDEFIELYNFAATNVALFDPAARTNTWHVRNGVEFDFPTNVTFAARSYLLLVGFDPSTNATTTASFRSRYGIGGGVPLFGPLKGKLANDDNNVELRRPDAPNANDVPYVLVEKVHYRDSAPWPSAADWNTNGTVGISLQRIAPQTYGNEPTNWIAGLPTAGATNGIAFGARPAITLQPTNRVVNAGTSVFFVANASGASPMSYQWRFNGIDLLNATNAIYQVTNAQYANVGRYSVRVMNPFGVALSSNALLTISGLPEVVFQPQSVATVVGSTVSFTVGARGTAPLAYQWRKDGNPIGNATGTTFSITNAQLGDAGNFTVVVSNSFGSITSAIAILTFNSAPIIVNQPQSTNVFVGQNAAFSVNAVGSVPLRYQWRFNGANIGGATNSTYTIVNAQFAATGNYSVLVSNTFGTVISSNAALLVTVAPTLTIVATDASAGEVGSNPGQFTIYRGGTSNTAISVGYAIGGTAQNGADYQPIPASVFFPVGVTSAVVNINAINDSAPESHETVVLTLNASPNYVLGSPSSATVTILDDDNVLPTATLTAPAAGSVYPVSPTNFVLAATASDPDGGVSKVEFYANGTNKIGEVIGAGPYAITWTNATPGTNLLTAVAIDVFGTAGPSAPVSIYVNAAPTVTITTPGDNSTVPQGDVQIAAAANDIQGQVTRVDFFVDGLFYKTVTNQPYSVSLTNAALGSYQAYAVAYDAFGLSGTGPAVNFTVVVANTNFADMFTNRGFISGLTNYSVTTNANASVEPGEQQHSNVGGRSMWLTWTAPALGVVTVDLLQSSFDTLLAIYTNQPGVAPTVSNILKVAQNDDSNAGGTNSTRSRVMFTNTIVGQQYHIAADGWRGATGLLQMHLSLSNTSPYITTQPVPRTNDIGTSASFSVAATGVGSFTYFWRFNGVVIPGATGSSYSLNNIQPTNNGVYDVIVSNIYGIATSLGANLVVRSTPIITQQPQPQSVGTGQNANFAVVAQGGSLVYQWRFNNGVIQGATSPTYVRQNVGPSDEGNYSCVITNSFGSITSAPAALTIATTLKVIAVQYSNGVFSGALSGGPLNRSYEIQVSTNMSEGWVPLTTVSNINGTASWSDTNSAPRRNYRARLLP